MQLAMNDSIGQIKAHWFEQFSATQGRLEKHRKLLGYVALAFLLMLCFLPEMSWAAEVSTFNDTIKESGTAQMAPWARALSYILETFTGGVAAGIATLGIIAMGIMALMGKLEWATAIKGIIGVALILGSVRLVAVLSGVFQTA